MTVLEPGEIRSVGLADALGERYLAYALSTITSRSLPDVRDGLKPVHRRLLFAMRQLKLDPKSGYKKCARVVGDVIGKYHPHGDQSVYDAMVRLAQDFAVRYPLVDGQGNFGNIDGDNAAAMRYTEARLTAVAEALLRDIDQDTVDFRGTYDGEEEEPVVMPAAFPNLLANGSQGIAVGMATSVPPHNVGELCKALVHLIKHPNMTVENLVTMVPGPDFPTGGILVEDTDSIRKAYETGKGGFRVRARWEAEDLGRGAYQIVVTEIPYQVQKSRLIERIAELITNKKLPLLGDVRDESTEEVRIVLEPKTRTVEAGMLMEMLFRMTDLENKVSLNLNVLDADGTPKVMSLREALQAFLDHRQEVLVRRSRYRLGKIERRLEILNGYLIVYLNLDEVIRIIREEDDPKAELMKTFSLTEVQAEAILNMRLRSLRKLEEMELRTELAALEEEKAGLETLLGSEELRWTTISDELKALGKEFGGKTELGRRRTDFGETQDYGELTAEALIEKEPVTVVCSKLGWIRAMKGHQALDSEIKYKDGDEGRFVLHAQTTDKLLVLSDSGRCYTIGCDKLPGGRGNGEPIRLIIDLPNDEEIVNLLVHVPERKLVLASTDGRGFLVEEDNIMAQTRGGKQVMNPGDGKKMLIAKPSTGDTVAVIGDNRRLLVFPLDEMPVMNRGRGVMLQKYRMGGLADLTTFVFEDGLSWTMGGSQGRTRTQNDLMPWQGKRAGAGRLPPNGFPKDNKFGD